MHRRILSLPVLALALVLSGCSEPEPVPLGSPGCSVQPVPAAALATYTRGSNWAQDLEAFEAYDDGHVDVHGSPKVGQGSSTVDRSVMVGKDDVAALLADLRELELFRASEGCYKSDEPKDDDADGGASFTARDGDRRYTFSVDGPAPSSVVGSQRRLARFMADLAKR